MSCPHSDPPCRGEVARTRPRRQSALCFVACLAFGGLFAVGGAGCGSSPISLNPVPRSFTPRDYDRMYEAWTRDANEFSFGTMQDVLDVTATFQSWEMRWAYVVRYASDYGLNTETRAAMLRATLADAEANHRFFVTMVGNSWRGSQLTGRSSAWRVVLVTPDGSSAVPVAVDPVEDDRQALSGYYPSINRLRHVYRIAFPAVRADGTRTIPRDAEFVLLRFTGVKGRVDLRWNLEAESKPNGTARMAGLPPQVDRSL